MLVVGLYDGNIAVYNLQKNVGVPNYQSDAKNGKHRDIVWQVGTLYSLEKGQNFLGSVSVIKIPNIMYAWLLIHRKI